jgi:hypothetical protein
MSEAVTDTTILVPAPDLTGDPGERLMDCVGFSFKRGKRKIAVVTFAESTTGHIARKWYELPEPMVQSCKFWRDVVLALGRQPEPSTSLNLSAVFIGRTFRVRVGYRKTPGTGRSGAGLETNSPISERLAIFSGFTNSLSESHDHDHRDDHDRGSP